MIYSRSVEYAIRAFVHLSQVSHGKYVMAKTIAAAEAIPAHFLAKVLQQLARKGLLRSSKGPTGGFMMKCKPEDVTLMQIVEALDGLAEFERCACGLAECNDQQPCGMHDSWDALRSRILSYLKKTSIADIVSALEEKRRLIEKPRKGRATARA